MTKPKTHIRNKKTIQCIFESLDYMCASSALIIEALENGHDVTQFPNGDIIVTEIKVINTHYKWNNSCNTLSQQEDPFILKNDANIS